MDTQKKLNTPTASDPDVREFVLEQIQELVDRHRTGRVSQEEFDEIKTELFALL